LQFEIRLFGYEPELQFFNQNAYLELYGVIMAEFSEWVDMQNECTDSKST